MENEIEGRTEQEKEMKSLRHAQLFEGTRACSARLCVWTDTYTRGADQMNGVENENRRGEVRHLNRMHFLVL